MGGSCSKNGATSSHSREEETFETGVPVVQEDSHHGSVDGEFTSGSMISSTTGVNPFVPTPAANGAPLSSDSHPLVAGKNSSSSNGHYDILAVPMAASSGVVGGNESGSSAPASERSTPQRSTRSVDRSAYQRAAFEEQFGVHTKAALPTFPCGEDCSQSGGAPASPMGENLMRVPFAGIPHELSQGGSTSTTANSSTSAPALCPITGPALRPIHASCDDDSW